MNNPDRLSPKHFVNHGSVLASGFMIPWDIVGLDETRRRILDLWQPGLQVKKTGSASIVLLPAPVRVIAGAAIGNPLVRHEGLLVGLPLEPKEVATLSPPRDSLIFAEGGRIQTVALAGLSDDDITEWIDTESAMMADVISLGAQPQRPAFQAADFDPRKIQGVPPASPELQKLLTELRQTPAPQSTSRVRLPVGLGLVNVWSAFKQLFQHIRWPSFWRKARVQTSAQPLQNKRPQVSARNSFWHWLSRGANRLLSFTRLSRLLSLRHARYLSRLVEMMQSGDIEEGLRHAIPLSDAQSMTNRQSSWFGVPQRRSSLTINPFRGPAQSTWALGSGFYEYLRNLYRQAFQRLEAQGRIDEAAFVLTELLASHAEAVSFLEKHKKFALAAEIAEAKKLSPAMAIRLWWLAKDIKRAVSLACRTEEFEAAIKHLSSSHPEEADKLRVFWAERLASSGKYLPAADTIWPVSEGHRLAHLWYTQAIDLGGVAGGVALARKAARFPESFSEVLPQVEELMANETIESARMRQAFAENLRRESRTPQSQVVARVAVRAIVRDIQQEMAEFTPVQLRQLMDYSGDVCLRTDVPLLEALKPATAAPAPVSVLEIASHDVGHRSITDLALLPNGQLLLALGEAGLLFLSRDGKPITQLNQPAHKLVVSDEGSRAIGIAPRGEVSRLVRIDTLARTASYWCDTTISAWTSNFDGSVWCVATGEDVFLIDTLARGFEALWRIPDLGGKVSVMRRNRKERRLYVVTESEKQTTLWTFDHPSCTLRSKQEFPPPSPADAASQQNPVAPRRVAMAISESGHLYEQLAILPAGGGALLTFVFQIDTYKSHSGMQTSKACHVPGSLRHASSQNTWMVIPARNEDSIEVFLLDSHSRSNELSSELRIRLQGSKEISLRFAENLLLCADDQGRVLALNVQTNKAMRDLRI